MTPRKSRGSKAPAMPGARYGHRHINTTATQLARWRQTHPQPAMISTRSERSYEARRLLDVAAGDVELAVAAIDGADNLTKVGCAALRLVAVCGDRLAARQELAAAVVQLTTAGVA